MRTSNTFRALVNTSFACNRARPCAPGAPSHYSMVGVVRCGNQKVTATLDSLLHYGACPYVARIQACVGVVRWLYSSHYSLVGVVRCGNQKVMGTLDLLLLFGACLYVVGCY